MGSDENHFNVLSIVRDKVRRQYPQTGHNIFEEKLKKTEAESSRRPSAYQPNVLPLGQTGSLDFQK